MDDLVLEVCNRFMNLLMTYADQKETNFYLEKIKVDT